MVSLAHEERMMRRYRLGEHAQQPPGPVVLQVVQELGLAAIGSRLAAGPQQAQQPRFEQCLLLRRQLDAEFPIRYGSIGRKDLIFHKRSYLF